MALNVLVKPTAEGGPTGQYQCDVTKDGLTLTQKQESINVPRGSRTEYLGGNQFTVSLPEMPVEVTVAKFGTFQNRMAKDLADYVGGQGQKPNLESYALPWYFYVLCALPLGLPVITMGGAIPGMVSVALVGSCYAILRKEDWPTTTRVLIAGVVVTTAYILFGSLTLLAVAGRGR
jgi:hypothetical protein